MVSLGRSRRTKTEPPWGLPRIGGSLRQRLVGLFALALLAPTLLSGYLAWNSFHEQQERARLVVRQLTSLAGTYERKFFEDTREQLQQLADQPAVHDGSARSCDDALNSSAEEAAQFAGLALYDRDGQPICATNEASADVAGRAWFQDALRSRRFTISDYTFTAESSQPAIVAAIPVFDESYDLVGILGASIQLYWLSAFLQEVQLPSEGVFYLLDSDGNVLANSASLRSDADAALPKKRAARRGSQGDGRQSLSTMVQPDLLQQVATRRVDDFQAVGNDGVRRVYSSVALPHGNVTLLFGAPAHTMLGWIRQDLISRILSISAIWLAGIAAAWIGTRHLVTRWTRDLRNMALDYARGDYAAKLDLQRAPSELRDLGGTLMLMANRIEDRESELRVSLDQKNMLLQEVHHRVKNNLQIVMSLLNIRSRGEGRGDDRDLVADVRTRVRALALVHRYLYEGDDVRFVDLRAFLDELCRMLVSSLAEDDERISLDLDVEPFTVTAEQAVSIGLLVTEIMTNSIKHAFPDGRAGRIGVSLQRSGRTAATLTVSDDGVGLPEVGGSTESESNLGLQLIRGFAAQLGSELEVSGDDGTRFIVHLNLDGESQGPGARGRKAARG